MSRCSCNGGLGDIVVRGARRWTPAAPRQASRVDHPWGDGMTSAASLSDLLSKLAAHCATSTMLPTVDVTERAGDEVCDHGSVECSKPLVGRPLESFADTFGGQWIPEADCRPEVAGDPAARAHHSSAEEVSKNRERPEGREAERGILGVFRARPTDPSDRPADSWTRLEGSRAAGAARLFRHGAAGDHRSMTMADHSVEYAMTPACAEGLLEEHARQESAGAFGKSACAGAARRRSRPSCLRRHGRVRSWPCELAGCMLVPPEPSEVEAYVNSGEGRSTVEDAVRRGLSIPTIALGHFAPSRSQGAFGLRAALRCERGGRATQTV